MPATHPRRISTGAHQGSFSALALATISSPTTTAPINEVDVSTMII